MRITVKVGWSLILQLALRPMLTVVFGYEVHISSCSILYKHAEWITNGSAIRIVVKWFHHGMSRKHTFRHTNVLQ